MPQTKRLQSLDKTASRLRLKSFRSQEKQCQVSGLVQLGIRRNSLRQKGIRRNGLRLKGIRRNGLRLKGIRRNGLRLKGIRRNGLRLKGIRRNGLRLKGIRQNGLRLKGIRQNGLRLKGIGQNGLRLKGIRRNGLRLKGIGQNGLRWSLEVRIAPPRMTSHTEISPGRSVTLSCQLYSDAGFSCVDLVRSEGVELLWVNQAGVDLKTDSRYQILSSSDQYRCIITLTTTLLNEDNNREWRCQLTHRNQLQTSVRYTVKYSAQADSTTAVNPSTQVIVISVAAVAVLRLALLWLICRKRAGAQPTPLLGGMDGTILVVVEYEYTGTGHANPQKMVTEYTHQDEATKPQRPLMPQRDEVRLDNTY
ncbi:unnamed protein product, partial [Leuciscus chuanchicus]